VYLDYSKNRVTDETLALLIQLAQESQVEERRDAMFRGEIINVSEHRAVLHVALRMPAGTELVVDGQDVVADVHAVLAGPVDTDMSRDLDIPKASPASVAQAILDGVARGDEEIFPDPMTEPMAEIWRNGMAKELERQNALLLQAAIAAAGA